MKTKKIEASIGIIPGYFHNNEDEMSNWREYFNDIVEEPTEMQYFTKILDETCKDVANRTGVYPSFIISQDKCVYCRDFGCPEDGELVFTISSVCNLVFNELYWWEYSVDLVIKSLKSKFQQSTVSVITTNCELEYKTDTISRFEFNNGATIDLVTFKNSASPTFDTYNDKILIYPNIKDNVSIICKAGESLTINLGVDGKIPLGYVGHISDTVNHEGYTCYSGDLINVDVIFDCHSKGIIISGYTNIDDDPVIKDLKDDLQEIGESIEDKYVIVTKNTPLFELTLEPDSTYDMKIKKG